MLIPDIVIKETNGAGRIAILDAKYRFFATPAEDHSIADQMALCAMTANMSAREPAIEVVVSPTMLLVYPKADPSNDSKGLNSSQKCGCIGKGRFLFENKREFPLMLGVFRFPRTRLSNARSRRA